MSAALVWTPYCGAAPLPAELLGRWNLDPGLLAILVLAGAMAAREASTPLRRACLAGAILLLLFLFVSPFCALTSALFSARAVHHVLLVAVVAPLIAMIFPGWRERAPGLVAATALQAATFWLWHAPGVYGWALSSDGGYWLMQTSLLGTAWLFWTAVGRAAAPTAVAALLATMVQMGLLGALITFAPTPLYAPHLASTLAWGWSALDDQQLAGLIMWAPAAGFYLAAALWLAGRWLGPDPQRAGSG